MKLSSNQVILVLFASLVLLEIIESRSASNATDCSPKGSTVICSGYGICDFGQCLCIKRVDPSEVIYGKYCECDNFSCDISNTLPCGGPEHGKCECGKCLCKLGWIGNACECSTSLESCISPKGGAVCSGNGDCVCGRCICSQDHERPFKGKYCDGSLKILT